MIDLITSIQSGDQYINNIIEELNNRKLISILIQIYTRPDYFYKFKRFFKDEYVNLKNLSDQELINALQSVLPSYIHLTYLEPIIDLPNFNSSDKNKQKIKKKRSKRDKKRTLVMKYLRDYPDNSAVDIIRLLEGREKIKVSFATIKKYKDFIKGERG